LQKLWVDNSQAPGLPRLLAVINVKYASDLALSRCFT